MNDAEFTQDVMQYAKESRLRTGQALFNLLPSEVANAVVGTELDTFHKKMTTDEVFIWIDNHLIFDDDRIIAVFDRNTILWEE